MTARRSLFVAAPILAGGLSATRPTLAQAIQEPAKQADFLFVQTARRMSFDRNTGRISLHGVSPVTLFFSDRPIKSWDDADAVNRERYARFFRAMLARNILLPPSPFEAAFLSIAHDATVIDETVEAAKIALREAIA